MGGALCRSVGGFRAWRPGEDQGRARSRGLQDLRRAARRMETVGRAAQAEMGGRREEGRRRSRRDLERAAGVADAVQRGLLTGVFTLTAAASMSRRRCYMEQGRWRKPKLPFPESPSRKMRRRATRWIFLSTASS